jgi:hypothetical protein
MFLPNLQTLSVCDNILLVLLENDLFLLPFPGLPGSRLHFLRLLPKFVQPPANHGYSPWCPGVAWEEWASGGCVVIFFNFIWIIMKKSLIFRFIAEIRLENGFEFAESPYSKPIAPFAPPPGSHGESNCFSPQEEINSMCNIIIFPSIMFRLVVPLKNAAWTRRNSIDSAAWPSIPWRGGGGGTL